MSKRIPRIDPIIKMFENGVYYPNWKIKKVFIKNKDRRNYENCCRIKKHMIFGYTIYYKCNITNNELSHWEDRKICGNCVEYWLDNQD